MLTFKRCSKLTSYTCFDRACLVIREAFQALDLDADGLISTDDVRTLLHLFNPDMEDSETQKIINEASSCGKLHVD